MPDDDNMQGDDFQSDGDFQQDNNQQQQLQQSGFDPTQIAQIAAQTAAQFHQQSQQSQPRQMSDEEMARALKQWSPSDEFVQEFHGAFNGENGLDVAKAKAVLGKMWNGMYEQARTYAEVYPQYLLEQRMQEINPMLQQAQQIVQQQREDRFMQTYPGLKQYKQILPQVAQQVLNSGMSFKDEKHQFEVLAKTAQQVLGQMGIKVPLSSGQGTGRKSASPMFGAGHGAGSGSGQTQGGASSIWKK